MGFEPVDQNVPNFPEQERRILRFWDEQRVFARSLEETEGKPEFVFYEGPPTANGLPHNGHVLTRVIKDLFPRYKTMRGYHVVRQAGWDTHGLPVEVEVEKELRISGKKAILDYGVDAFAKKCLASVFRYTNEWEALTDRIGFWVNLEDAYVTFHKSYVESVWWALSQLFDKGLLYQGHKVVWWWPQGGTALSAGEVGNAYRTVEDPSVYVRFPLVDEAASLLVWTTTPWTLPSNMFAAVHAELEYAYVRDEETGECLVVAEGLRASLGEKFGRTLSLVRTVPGAELIGKRYRPPYDMFEAQVKGDERYFRVVAGDRSSTDVPQWFVTLDAGTGVVHVAPAFGEDDWKVWRNESRRSEEIPLLNAVRADGCFGPEGESLGISGMFVKDADKPIIKDLKARNLLHHAESYRHEYPFCWRSDKDPLIQYARSTWFVRTTDRIDRVIENNQRVAWAPEHIRDGRFGDFLAGNVDWALSRERFWGTPLNIWICSGCGEKEAPASCKAIEARNPEAFSAFEAARREDPNLSEHLRVHKPWIDGVVYPCAACGKEMRRVPDVIDCWFDSGCMPFAQHGYPHREGSVEAFERRFPADFISEAIDQTRGWFYSLMMVSNLVFDDVDEAHPYRRCIVLGHVLDQAGKKESKSTGNYTPPEVILDSVAMPFAVAGADEAWAAGRAPADGTVLVSRSDLDGLALKDGGSVLLRGGADGADALSVRVRADKRVPRRRILLPPALMKQVGCTPAPENTLVVEVPGLPADQRVVLEDPAIPAPGADAFRWFFYSSGPPWSNVRHSLANVRTAQKELPIKLHNVYAFFVTYANIDHFDPVSDEGARRSVAERALLDRWVLSELERTKQSVIEHMDAYRSYEATLALGEFVDGLSNWYVRRSRDRFWASGREADKLDALWTLYEVLRDLSLVIAPFLPFAAEEMYQNLVARRYGDRLPPSVHLRAYPVARASQVDGPLSEEMQAVRDLVSLGLQVRASHRLKTRQTLSEAKLILSAQETADRLVPYVDVIKEELNVQSVSFLANADEFVHYTAKPDFKKLGRRLGAQMKAVQARVQQADPADILRALEADGAWRAEVDGESIELSADELVVGVVARDGFAAASSAVGVVVLDTRLTPELVADGLFRELLARIQARRKALELPYAARIGLAVWGSEEVLEIGRARVDSLKQETLAQEVQWTPMPDAEAVEVKVGPHPVHIAIRTVATRRPSQA